MQSISHSRPVGYLMRAGIAASTPIRGIWYFLRNREFWPLFFSRLLPLSLISLLVYLVLFAFAFLPQYAFLAIFHGWGAWVNAVVLVLGEGLVIVQGLFEGFFVDECRVDVFDVSRLILPVSVESAADCLPGHSHQALQDRPYISAPSPLRRCANGRKDAWKAYELGHIHSMEHHANRGAHRVPSTQSCAVGGDPSIHHYHWNQVGKAVTLQMVSNTRLFQGREKEGG